MSKFKDLFISSYQELKNVRCITLCAVFGAISIVLGFYTVMIADFLKVGFTFLPNEFIYYLFGPAVGAVFGAAMDILTFIVKPTGSFFPGFTISAILNGLIFGFILYKRPVSLKRIILATVIQLIFINILLNTFWLTILLGKGFYVMLPLRALKEFILFPFNTILLYTTMKAINASGIIKLLHNNKTNTQ